MPAWNCKIDVVSHTQAAGGAARQRGLTPAVAAAGAV